MRCLHCGTQRDGVSLEDHDRRVTELLQANNAMEERMRAAVREATNSKAAMLAVSRTAGALGEEIARLELELKDALEHVRRLTLDGATGD